MKSIGTRFSIVAGLFALAFSGVVLYRAWSSANRHTEEMTSTQAQLALGFDLAIREYVKEAIRPEMEKRVVEDEFVVEAMSTSYVARQIVDKVRRKFPDYLLKFPSDNPRNPTNKAGPEEEELLQFFRDNPEEERWCAMFFESGGRKIRGQEDQEGRMTDHSDPCFCPWSPGLTSTRNHSPPGGSLRR